MMVAVGLARVGVGVKIRTPAYTLIYPHLDQQMIRTHQVVYEKSSKYVSSKPNQTAYIST